MSAPTLQPTADSTLLRVPAHLEPCLPAPGLHTATPATTVWTATGHERPVFLDERGRRRRWVALGGALTATAAALWLGGLVAGGVGFSRLPSWHALPAVAQAPSTAVPARARVARVNRSPNRDRRDDLVVRWRTGTPPSRRARPVLVATTRLN